MGTKDDLKIPLQQNIIAIAGIIFGAAIIIISSIIIFAWADSINPGVFSPDSKLFGLTYAEWTAKWWQWLLSYPPDVNPANDDTGRFCAQGQNSPVWFLAGTFGGASAERSCTIPSKKAILFPVINSECSFAEYPSIKTKSQLEMCAKADNDLVTTLEATVDGRKLQHLEKYRILSPIFNITLREGNPIGATVGPTQMMSDGFYVFLEPLSAGKHEIDFIASTAQPPTVNPSNLNLEIIVKYHLTVTP